MLMIKRLGLVAAIAASAGLAGCASDAQTSAPPPAPPAATAPAPAPAPMPAPQPLSGAELTKAVQTALNHHGARLKVDGKMGKATHAALRRFQHQNHLKPTGRPDDATLKALGIQG